MDLNKQIVDLFKEQEANKLTSTRKSALVVGKAKSNERSLPFRPPPLPASQNESKESLLQAKERRSRALRNQERKLTSMPSSRGGLSSGGLSASNINSSIQ